MAYATGEVVRTPDDDEPFKVVVFAIGGEIISEWPVASREEGERQIAAGLRGLRAMAAEGSV